MMKIFVLNGPNLNLLGERDREIYGTETLEGVERSCAAFAGKTGLEVDFRQTNDEGEFIGWVQEARTEAAGLVINPAALTHYSFALRDAVASVGVPVVEVHISNIYAREEWRAKSVISPVARGVIAGLGVRGYSLAIRAMAEILQETRD